MGSLSGFALAKYLENHTGMKLKPWVEPGRLEAGCDEAGRGCLAGPVTASAVVLGTDLAKALCEEGILNDSKQLSEKNRDALRIRIESEAESWAVCFVDSMEIDEINILQASFAAMRRAVKKLNGLPDFMLIDGNRFRTEEGLPPFECYVKGDARFASIAAASVLAKTHRDERMRALSLECPGYGWETNAGYPTRAHRDAIRKMGVTSYHRRSFRQLPEAEHLFEGR